jgi:hypothetical protein
MGIINVQTPHHTVRPEASLLPTSTFYFPNGSEQPISIMIASHYTLVNPQFSF